MIGNTNLKSWPLTRTTDRGKQRVDINPARPLDRVVTQCTFTEGRQAILYPLPFRAFSHLNYVLLGTVLCMMHALAYPSYPPEWSLVLAKQGEALIVLYVALEQGWATLVLEGRLVCRFLFPPITLTN